MNTIKRMGTTVLVVLLGIGLSLVPQLAFAQGSNPFADAGAQSTAISVIQSLRFWVWIAAAVGGAIYAIAYFIQGLLPDFYNSVRGWIRNAVLIAVVFGVVMEFILAQATSAQGPGL